MSSLLKDDTRYVKLWLLLVKGGTYVFMKHTQKMLDNDNITIDVCLEKHRDKLFKVKNIYPKLWELLCSKSKDINVLDISAHAYVLLNLFGKKLNAVEKVVLTKLRVKRNELGHPGDRPLPEEDFLGEWSQLTKVLHQLSSGLSSNDQDYVDKLICDISEIKYLDKATNELKPYENQEDFVKDVLAKLQYSYKKRFDELVQRINDLEKRTIEKDLPGLEEWTKRICVLEKLGKEIDKSGKKFIFRYQYLLIEVGTDMLKRVFDHIVGPDLRVYLDNNPSQKNELQKLVSRNILPTVQHQLLHPTDSTQSLDNSDITILTCLLRYICGLCPSSDQVWLNPQPTDKSVEAYITRLRLCRNDFAHSRSVFEDEAVLTTKWDDLCLILQGLSSFCGFDNLQAEIDKVKYIDLNP